MDFTNTCIFTKAESIAENEYDECIKIGKDMLEFYDSRKLLCIAANQLGINKKICVVLGDIFFNPVVTPVSVSGGGELNIDIKPEKASLPMNILSFPRKKVLVPMADKVSISAYSVKEEDRIEFDADKEVAAIWQTVDYCLQGVKESDVVDPDYMTIKSEPKRRPNDKCPTCGKKNKRCVCP